MTSPPMLSSCARHSCGNYACQTCQLRDKSAHTQDLAVNCRGRAAGSVSEALLRAQLLEGVFGPGPQMPDHLGGGEGAEPRRGAVIGGAREADEESCGEE